MNTVLEGIEFSPNILAGSVTSLFKLKDDSKPYHAGTMFAVKIDEEVYFITAGHVLKKNQKYSEDSDDQIFAIVDGKLTQITSFDKYIVFNAKDNELDVVAIKPKNISWDRIFTKFISEADMFMGKIEPEHYLCAYGLPETQNKIRWQTDVLSNVRYGYFGKSSKRETLSALGFGEEYIGIDISLKKAFINNQKEIPPAKPQGISGGPIYITHNFSNPTELFEPKLVGVTFEKMINNQGILGVKFSSILAGFKMHITRQLNGTKTVG